MKPSSRLALGFCSLWLTGVAVGGALSASELPSDEPLTPENRLAIFRGLAFEYATARQPLPACKKREEALEVTSTGVVNEDKLRQSLANRAAAVHTGEVVQITAVRFNRDSILLEINGGKKKQKWYQRIQIEAGSSPAGGGPPVQTSSSPPPAPGSEPPRPSPGSWILLTFPQVVPNITLKEVKQMLAPVLHFSQRSAAVPWIETIPEEFRQAIKEKKAVVGMNREMVLAALGRPDRKVRENKQGQETEDWIYGHPPLVTFVSFADDKVVEVKEFR